MFLLSMLFSHLAAGFPGGPEGAQDIAPRCAQLCADTMCEVIAFRGFSADSSRIAYSLLQCPGVHGEGKAKFTWQVREISKGKGKLRLRRVESPGERHATWFKKQGFTAREIPGREVEKNKWLFNSPEGSTLSIELATEKRVAWYLDVTRKERHVFRYRGEFEEIYFELKPWVYLAPDNRKVAVVLALNGVIRVDAGIAVFSLDP